MQNSKLSFDPELMTEGQLKIKKLGKEFQELLTFEF